MTTLLIESALRSLALALAVWIALRVFRVRNVLAEKAAWILVLSAAVTMPLMLMLAAHWPALPAPRLVLPAMAAHEPARVQALLAGPAAAKPAPASASTVRPAAVAPVPRETPRPRAEALSNLPPRFVSKTMDPATPAPANLGPAAQDRDRMSSPQSTPLEVSPPQPFPLARGAAILYLLIAGALCLRLLAGLGATVRVWRAAAPVPALKLEVAEGLRLRASDRIAAPVTIGSGVLLPAEYSAWGEEKLRIVLAHERSHVRQRDFYLQLLASLYAALLWLSPLGWWLKRKLYDLGEAIGDRSGLEEAASCTSYARVLLEFAAAPRPTVIGVAMARPSSLSRRMERLLNESAFRQAFSSRGRAFAAALLLPVLFFAAATLVRVEAAGDSGSQAAAVPAQAKAQQAVRAAELAQIEAQREAAAAQNLAEAQVQAANTQETAADEATREAEAAQALAEAQAQAASAQQTAAERAARETEAAAALAEARAQAAQAPEGVRTLIVMNSPSANGSGSGGASADGSGASGYAFAYNQADGVISRFAGGHALVRLDGSAAEATFDRTLSFSGKLELHVATGSGNIHLTRGSAGQVVIHGRVRSEDAEEAAKVQAIASNPPIEQNGSTIRIGKEQQERGTNHISIDYDIQAPADAALEAAAGSGNITDEGVGQGANLETGSGNINATGLSGGFKTETGSGNIAIDEAGDGDAKAETGSGDIDVKGVHGAFKAETGSGTIKVQGTPTSPWKLETGSGDVEFSPGNAPLTLDISTGSGKVSADQAMALKVSSDGHKASGQLNGGGPMVVIETGSGDVRVHD